jgi:hypothetical protein
MVEEQRGTKLLTSWHHEEEIWRISGWLPHFIMVIPSRSPAYWMVMPTFKESLSSLITVPHINCFWKCPHRHTQRCALLILNLVKLTVKIKLHNYTHR